ncbi:MAG: DUF2314 domain-containing protein [Verrucomicrobia bacterium]|nr:DUF2314 domain-containing protein [Verrucomicrobiota bacterium]
MPSSPVFAFASDDPAMLAASVRARATFKYFWRELSWEYRRIVPAFDLAAVKAAFRDPDGDPENVEHMWLGEVEFDGDMISAMLLNEPHGLESVHGGDAVCFPLAELEDWMLGCEGKIYGGFTVQVIRQAMDRQERREHDEAWGFDFGDPAQPKLVPEFAGQSQGAPTSANPDVEHVMSENMVASLAQAIDKNPGEFLRSSSHGGLTMLHSMALAGSASGVRVLLAKGADRNAQTERGRTALDLARQMGWPRVVELLQA